MQAVALGFRREMSRKMPDLVGRNMVYVTWCLKISQKNMVRLWFPTFAPKLSPIWPLTSRASQNDEVQWTANSYEQLMEFFGARKEPGRLPSSERWASRWVFDAFWVKTWYTIVLPIAVWFGEANKWNMIPCVRLIQPNWQLHCTCFLHVVLLAALVKRIISMIRWEVLQQILSF